MAHIHNMFLRGMNAIYHQCESVTQPKDVNDFTLFIKAWADGVHTHHEGEEVDVFPVWDELARAAGASGNVTKKNVEQHHAFETGFNEFKMYVEDVIAGTAKWDGTKAKAMLVEFAPILNVHLHDEVNMILDMEKYDGKVMQKAMDVSAQKSLKKVDPVCHPDTSIYTDHD